MIFACYNLFVFYCIKRLANDITAALNQQSKKAEPSCTTESVRRKKRQANLILDLVGWFKTVLHECPFLKL